MDTTTNMIEIWQTLNIILNQDITKLNLSNPFQNRVYQRCIQFANTYIYDVS